MVSSAAYRVASVELVARLWSELERVPRIAVGGATAGDADTGVRLEIVRLELALAIDACDPARRFFPLTRAQRLAVRAVLSDVLAALGRTTDGALPAALAWAQDRLLDAILAECPDGGARDGQALKTGS